MPNKIKLNQDFPSIKKSDDLYNRALNLIPSVTQTLAKGPQQNIKGIAPKYLQKGKGSHVWDVDGNEYIDFNMGIGPLSLGYAYNKVDAAIKKQLEEGITFSLMHPLEVEVAEMINDIIPNAESIRYSKTGADVTSAAIRVARAFTGRKKVLCCGYHGWHDWYISVTDRNKGIPNTVQDLTFTFNYNDIQSLKDSIDDETAAVILEPFVFEEPKDNFLEELREICTKNETLLIFDEMWTGFRIALGGAQEYFNIKADLATYSKAIANGMPIAVLTGRKDVMSVLEKDVFFYTTFGGEALSLAAAKATLTELKEKNVPEYLSTKGKILKDGYNQIAKENEMNYTKCIGYECRSIMTFDPSIGNPLEMKSLVQQEMIKRGILWGGFHNMSYSHNDDEIEYTLKAYKDVLPILKKAVQENNIQGYLRGEPVEPVFRKVGNFNTKPVRKN
ncbi:MAG: aminotransferase class III-fold pyridoxal phosphate-dependent enzyme [Ignavibacteria bacterium]|nr:aminotransferase class III-fold pyridoxal phosphate-dependent enzyme [Ignavibacteria bacterium]MBT8381131.1 aminotransferase class III-fold pyridoxal phosphate-dependent enzyme [Ignavibacteria bacterium]MBT8392812.1 aminotransferase class III-fold pyridoxal phosphate-dependent enzyme [Ignavibacteria bacterium]NNL22116.1 aminotransferase class III-fold pyridoxal phosphate-dependent enzyme [Ignavibacteriaceae bacterium]